MRLSISVSALFCVLLGALLCTGCQQETAISDSSKTHIYIADTGNNRIVSIDNMEGKNWTTLNTASGQKTLPLDTPSGLFVDANNRIFIADSGNYRVIRTDNMSGDNWIVQGQKGDGVGQFKRPVGIYVDRENKIYVTDPNNCRVSCMNDMAATEWVVLPSSPGSPGKGIGHFNVPTGIFIDGNSNIYITDASDVLSGSLNNRIIEMHDMQAADWRDLGSGFGNGKRQFNKPSGICVDKQGKIYIADTYNNRIVRMDDITGKNWVTFGGVEGADINQFNTPTGIWVDGDYHIYIADTNNDRIVRIDDMTGKNWIALGTTGSSSKQFRSPGAIFVR